MATDDVPSAPQALPTARDRAYEERLAQTVQQLRGRVSLAEEGLTKIGSSVDLTRVLAPSPDPTTRLRQVRVLKAAYDSLAPTEPILPSPGSVLPALLALRETKRLIDETRLTSDATEAELARAKARLESEKSFLHDARLLATSLEKRIKLLEVEREARAIKSADETARDLIAERQRRKTKYVQDTKALVKAFNVFLDDHLAAMLVAEELGGPVVGDGVEPDGDDGQAASRQAGKTRKVKSSLDERSRQRLIDEIWGPVDDPDRSDATSRSENDAAAAEMRALTEELLNAAGSTAGAGSAAYVEVPRDSAAVRFLVRAKVAQFHPKDARRVRLIDFGREIEE